MGHLTGSNIKYSEEQKVLFTTEPSFQPLNNFPIEISNLEKNCKCDIEPIHSYPFQNNLSINSPTTPDNLL